MVSKGHDLLTGELKLNQVVGPWLFAHQAVYSAFHHDSSSAEIVGHRFSTSHPFALTLFFIPTKGTHPHLHDEPSSVQRPRLRSYCGDDTRYSPYVNERRINEKPTSAALQSTTK